MVHARTRTRGTMLRTVIPDLASGRAILRWFIDPVITIYRSVHQQAISVHTSMTLQYDDRARMELKKNMIVWVR